jgi:hypothetical protein
MRVQPAGAGAGDGALSAFSVASASAVVEVSLPPQAARAMHKAERGMSLNLDSIDKDISDFQ